MRRIVDVVRGAARAMRPHFKDARVFSLVAVAFGIGVLVVSWHARSLRFEVEAANLAWIALVAFGMTWHAEMVGAARMAAGVAFGALAAAAGYYGSLVLLPITALGLGLGLGITGAAVVVICHMYPRVLSFPGAAVGIGVGIAAARSVPLRVITPLDDVLALLLTTAACIAVGAFGSVLLRAFVLRMGEVEYVEEEEEDREPRMMWIPHIPHLHLPHIRIPRRHAATGNGKAPTKTKHHIEV